MDDYLLHRRDRFRSNEARLQLSLLAYNPRNPWRRLVIPKRIDAWSLTSLQQRLVKTRRRLVKHARYCRYAEASFGTGVASGDTKPAKADESNLRGRQ
jgi:hypothetical protein